MIVTVRRGGGSGTHPLSDLSGSPLSPPRTTASLAYDDTAFTVRFVCAGTPPFRAEIVERNGPVYEDECVEVFLCVAGSETRYQEIVVNSRGVVYGALVENPDDSRETWHLTPGVLPDALTVNVSVGEASWTCELSIPWGGALGPAPQPGTIRRGNLYRIARGDVPRFEALSPTLRSAPPDFHVPSRFARFELE